MRKIRFVKLTYCQTFVSPGIGAVTHTRFVRKALMTLDLPTFGYPMNPTEIFCLSDLKRENCLRTDKSAPFPNGFVTEAWNAMVGYSFDNAYNHRLVTHAGTKSTLLSNRIKCLCRFIASIFKCFSKCSHRVPKGSLTSNT